MLYNPFITGYYDKSRIQINESYSMARFGSGGEFYGDHWDFSIGVSYGFFNLKDMAIDRKDLSSTKDNYSDISYSILSFDVNFCYLLSSSIPLGISISAFAAGTFDSYNHSSSNNIFYGTGYYGTDNEKVSHSYGSGGFGFGLKYFVLNNLSINIDYLWIAGEATQKLGFRTSYVD
jgi:hypothetical protein